MKQSGRAHELPEVLGLQLWGGHECTVNRTGDRYLDETRKTGHEDRVSDLERFASLGLKALRYPVLWERISPGRPEDADWRWTDERLHEIRRLGMRPIAGLTHHGSGPRHTHLLDDGFAPGLARHARAVAQRYPWIGNYTPVNEPLTTARFSALYGHWYPHARDETAFFTALLNQIDATRLSMKAIREVNPHARLIQTDDLGHTFATRELAYQADYENERRWLSWDLLSGKLDPSGQLMRHMESLGLGDRARAILDDPCPPDVIGVNHYLASERFLDHRIERYPRRVWGGNGRDTYADVEAVRVLSPGPMGIERLLELTHQRYGVPVAVTECHNGCSREEQMRWLVETWRAAERLRTRGVPIEAVTVWSLLGSLDWNSLLTRDDGHYEVGVYDVRGGRVHETAMVQLCRDLAAGRDPSHPATDGPGWWSRDIRYSYEPVRIEDHALPRRSWIPPRESTSPILITGATGTLGRAFARACEHRGLAYTLTGRGEMDLVSDCSIAAALKQMQPWAVVNTAGWVRVDDAETDPASCMEANARGVERLAAACAALNLPLVGFSSDLVFDGRKGAPYTEADEPNPLNVYGRSKAEAEQAIIRTERGLAIRTAAFFSPFDRFNFAHAVTDALSHGRSFEAADDLFISPTYVPDLVEASLDLLIDGERGIRHLASPSRASWASFARMVAMALDLEPRLIVGKPASAFGWAAARPRDVCLGSERPGLMRPLEDALTRYAALVRPGISPPLVKTTTPRRGPVGEARSFVVVGDEEAAA